MEGSFYQCKKVQKRLSANFKKLVTTERFSDCRFTIVAADGVKTYFDCHKLVFVCASSVFERMFNGEFLESQSDEIVLQNVRPDVFAKFREFIYTYDIKLLKGFDENTLIDLVKFGQQYLVTSVTEECIKILTQRTSILDIEMLIQLYQLGNNMLRKDLIQPVGENITSRFPDSMNHDSIYNLSSDAFFKYMEMSKKTLREVMRFDMIETYLKLNGFKVSKDISKPSDDFYQVDFKTTEAFEEDMYLEQLYQVDDNELEDDNKTKTENNVPNADNKEVNCSYIKNLFELIDYRLMTPQEFIDGPGRSDYFEVHYHKNDTLHVIALHL